MLCFVAWQQAVNNRQGFECYTVPEWKSSAALIALSESSIVWFALASKSTLSTTLGAEKGLSELLVLKRWVYSIWMYVVHIHASV